MWSHAAPSVTFGGRMQHVDHAAWGFLLSISASEVTTLRRYTNLFIIIIIIIIIIF